MDAAALYEEITATIIEWACREPTEWFEHACGRPRNHAGDHAEIHGDKYRTVTIWPAEQ